MNLSLKWLADYVDCGVSVKEFCAGMTMSGSKVETYETEGEVVKNVIVGKLVSITPHENSDHLQVCQVDVGGDSPIQIVTGAQNIVEGALVPVAMIGRDAFQEVDITGITMPITKHNFLVKRVEDLADTIREAFRIAKSGRPGPVLVDVPKDVQNALYEYLSLIHI